MSDYNESDPKIGSGSGTFIGILLTVIIGAALLVYTQQPQLVVQYLGTDFANTIGITTEVVAK